MRRRVKELSDEAGGSTAVTSPVIDASVHIFVSPTRTCARTSCGNRSAAAASPTTRWTGTAHPAASTPTAPRVPAGQYPGSDPAVVATQLFTDRGVDIAILHPMTRGIMPDRHLGTAIAAAHNEMMVTRWLEHAEFGDKFRGTIRVNPDDITGALREIDKYKDHPQVVQIGIPLQSRELYGKPQFWPLWEAAVDAEPAGRRAHRGRLGSRVAADAVGHDPHLRAVRRLHGAELPLPPDEHDRRGRIRADARAEVRLGRRRRRHADAVHVADGLLRPTAPRADAVGAEDAQRLPARATCSSCRAASTDRATSTSPASGPASPARTTW